MPSLIRPCRLFISSLFLSFLTLAASAQIPVLEGNAPSARVPDTGRFPSSPSRTVIGLSGTWSLSENGSDWQEITVPSSVDAVGRFVFRRTVSIPGSLLEDHVFTFVSLGLNHDVEVFVNDTYIGRHVGGYTSFEFEIPDGVLQPGSENAIEIIATNELSSRSTVPVRQQSWGWRTYGGMIRDVFLVALPKLWIDQLRPRVSYDAETGAGTVRLETTLSGVRTGSADADSAVVVNASASYLFEASLVDMQTGVEVARSAPQVFIPEPNKSVDLRTTLSLPGARVWSPARPDLYVLRTSVFSQEGRARTIVDQTSRTIGFTDIVSRDGRIFERGAPLHLRGVVWHEESVPEGASLSYEQMERDMAMIRSLGANAVRFAFHPPHPYLLDLASQYGLYALVEVPVWNVPASILSDETFRTLAQQSVREMVDEFAHHPAVLAWGVGGCIDPSDARAADFVKTMTGVVSSLDGRRTYAAIAADDEDRTAPAVGLAALMVDAPDVKDFRSRLKTLRTMYPDRPAVVIAYGVQVDEENRNGYRDPRSQEAQARFFLQYIAAVKESGFAGGFVDAFSDWRGDRPVLTVRSGDRTVHPLGLVSIGREKRLAFDVVRSQYQEEKFSAIPAGSYKARFPASQVVTGLLLIIIFGYQYSYNRRFGESVKRALLRSYNFFADLRDRADVPGVATFILSVCIAVTLGVVLGSMLYHFRTDPTADALMTVLLPWDALKGEMVAAAWDPIGGIVLFSAFSFVLALLCTLLIKVVSIIARVRMRTAVAWNITVWGGLPLMILSPVGMSLFKIMETTTFVLPVIFLIAFVYLWAISRIIKGTSVVLDVSTVKTYGITLLVVVVVGGGVFLLAENQWALSAYLDHLPIAVGAAR